MSDITKIILDEFRKIVREEVLAALQEVKSNHSRTWVNKKQVAEYLNVSESWINQRINEIPHADRPIRFKLDKIDEWRESHDINENISEIIKVNKSKNTFRVT